MRDTCTGIPAKAHFRPFKRFHRSKGARGRPFQGSGPGLALVQEKVKPHDGRVEVQCAVEAGGSCPITLPLGVEHLPADHIGTARQPASTGLNSKAGGRITLTAEQLEYEVVVRVRDTAIPAGKLPNSVDMFVQVGGSCQGTKGGPGLGLTLVQRLVQMCGGSL